MNDQTLLVFKKLMTDGVLSKETDSTIFSYTYEPEIAGELEQMEEMLDFKLYKTGGRIYLIPNQTNELFLQSNRDFRRSVGSDANMEDIYLYNYLANFLLHSLYGGSGENLQTRFLFRVTDLIVEFTKHCEQVKKESEAFERASEQYSMDFLRLADLWLAKKSGDSSTKSKDTKYGCVMKIIRKFRDEELLYESEDDIWKPTRRLNDLMPYFLSQQRVAEVNSVFEGRGQNAVDQPS